MRPSVPPQSFLGGAAPSLDRRSLLRLLGGGAGLAVAGRLPLTPGAGAAPARFAPAEEAKIDWRQFEGTALTVMLVPHPYTDAFKAAVPQFEALTGMTVNVTALPYNQAADRILADLSSGQGQLDVVFSGYPWDWQFGSFYVPLDDYLNDSQLTDADWYAFDDFMPLVVESTRWDRVPGHQLGSGSIFTIPTMVETYILAYRKDLFDKYGIAVPKTWDEFTAAAQELTRDDDGDQLWGLIARGAAGVGPIMTTLLPAYAAHGLSDFNEQMESVINAPAGVELTDQYIQTLKAAHAPGWAEVVWDDALHRFAGGGYAMIHDIDFGAATYEDANASSVAGKVAYALPPTGPEGHASNIWYWGLALNKGSRQTEAAWLLIEWATSQQVLREATISYRNFDPTRLSVWNDPEVVAMIGDWGGGTYRPVVEEVLADYAKLRWTPQPQISQTGTIWSEGLQQAYAGQASTKDALDEAAQRITELMRRSSDRP